MLKCLFLIEIKILKQNTIPDSQILLFPIHNVDQPIFFSNGYGNF